MKIEKFKTDRLERRWMITGIIALCIIVLIIPLSVYKPLFLSDQPFENILKTPVFVGRETCKDCHKPGRFANDKSSEAGVSLLYPTAGAPLPAFHFR